ncbi:MAG: hypothetical protein LLG15_06950 [Betaproteobacteria bacterium]|nr:hypothetical protein [Betaproteobacteria bacterium]
MPVNIALKPFAIPDLTPDARPWRVDWFGEVAYSPNGQRRSQPVYRVLISPVIGDLPVPNIVTDDGDQREAWLPIGTLPMVVIGDIWQGGVKVAQPNYQQESFSVDVSCSLAHIIKSGISIENHFLLPLVEHRLHRGATQSYCICVSMNDGKRLIVPCMELIRFYFGTTSTVLHKLFTGLLREEMLWSEKSFDPANGHLHIKLASRISGASASDIGRIALSKGAWRSAAGIYASCVAATSQKRTAYPHTGFPFTGRTTLQVSGSWLSFASEPDSTFVVYRLHSCSHRFPFETLSYEVDALKAHQDAQKRENAGGDNRNGAWARKGGGTAKPTISGHDPDIKKSGVTHMTFGKAKFPDLSHKAVWLEKMDTMGTSGVFIKHTDGSVEQVAFGEAEHGGQGRETDIVHAGAERGHEPSKLKLPGFVTLGIKMATADVSALGKEAFAKVVVAPGCSEPVFPLPRLVDEDGVVDPITDCNNADMTIRQRRACFLRIEDMAGGLFQLVVVIEAQKLAMPPVVKVVWRVELAEVVRIL